MGLVDDLEGIVVVVGSLRHEPSKSVASQLMGLVMALPNSLVEK